MLRPLPILLALLLLAVLAGVVLAQGGYDLSWHTVDGGGGVLSGGGYTLAGTVGQPDAGTLSGGSYTLLGGFWSGVREALRNVFLPVLMRM